MRQPLVIVMVRIACNLQAFYIGLAGLHLANKLRKGVDLLPVGELHHAFGIGRALGQPHNQSNHLAVPKPVFWIVNFSGKYGQLSGPPGDLLQKFP